MTIMLHNSTGLALSLGLAWLLAVLSRRRSVSSLSTSVLVVGALGMLVLHSGASAILYRGDNFGRIQVLAWSLFLHAPLLLLACAPAIGARWRAGMWAMSGTALALGLVALQAFVIEPRWLEVSRLTVPSPKLAEPVRIVLLADIQTDAAGRYEARVLRQAMAEEPDLVLFAGDYIQRGPRSRDYDVELAALRDLLLEVGLAAPLGGYAIAGNADAPGLWPRLFEGLPVTATETLQRYDLGPLVLTALGIWDSFGTDVRVGPAEKFHIVLGHSPDFSLAPVEADLLLAGHTHGGQVRLPFLGPLLTLSRVPRSWASGMTTLEPGRTLIVSRGIGLERGHGPQLRFLCRPELVVIDLVPGE
jgi:uncharacterized protein